MEQHNPEKNIKEIIAERIADGKVAMRPQWHFVLKAALAALGVALFFLAALMLTSFILFATGQAGIFFGPGFGPSGWFALLRAVPWLLIAVALLFVAVLEILVRHYAFAYRKPLIYSVLILLGGIFILGFILAPIHRRPFRDARMHRLPMFAERFYEGFGPRQPREFVRGVVTECTPEGCIVEDFRDETSTIVLPPGVRFFAGRAPTSGDEVVILGAASGTEFFARGVRVIVPVGE